MSDKRNPADRIRRVVVLGANGTMGYQSGALFAAADVDVVYLARTKEKAEKGREGAANAVRSAAIKSRISCGGYDDLGKHVPDADLIFEAVAEDLDIKRALYEKVDAARRDDSIVATVSSGLSIDELVDGRSDSFARNFCGLHFFNPPQVMVGTELIGGKATDPQVLDFVESYSEKVLGRVMVRTANTAGFAGNRVGFKVLNEAAQLAMTHGPLLVDRLLGPYTGRAMPPLRTIDLVGWDVHRAIVDNVCAKVEDEAIATYRMPERMRALLEQGTLGDKGGYGFFKSDGKGKPKLVLDPTSGEYRPESHQNVPELPFVDEIVFLHRIGEYGRAMQRFAEADGELAEMSRRVIGGYISYSFHRVGEVTESIAGIDRIMAAGFNWAPPSALVDTIGKDRTVKMIEQAGLPVPKQLTDAIARAGDGPLFDEPRLSLGRYFVAAA
ncbi:MAG: 3-hydroxyacyl-CoA dehydrogenase family protein [Myxococcales bacterium]|nr:3-hydroxyacyl-CoA dehydrogenase family protein [Myxococcales bacterium]